MKNAADSLGRTDASTAVTKDLNPFSLVKGNTKYMPNLLVRVKILPKVAEIKPDQIVEDLKTLNPNVVIRGTKEEPIAFGLVALIADFITDDEAGAMEQIEEAIRKSSLVGEFEVMGASRISASVGK